VDPDSLNPDLDPAFQVNPDLDTDIPSKRFDDQKLMKKLQLKKLFIFVDPKLQFTYP
jgi:hypothetical protein